MEKNYSYLILGAGKQGVAAAYDVALFGNARQIILADGSFDFAQEGSKRIQKLCKGKTKAKIVPQQISAQKYKNLVQIIRGNNAVLSALPYYFNPSIAQAAIEARVNYCDLGGYQDSTDQILKLNSAAKKAGVTLIPDCGVAPGMCNSLAVSAMEQLSSTESVKMYCGGLPQKPQPPLGYGEVFNLEGLIGNYLGKSYVLRDGKIKLIPSLTEYELLDFGAPIGKLEAVITGGATSTCPWTFKKSIQEYVYKTLRYPGHYEKIITLRDLGLLSEEEVQFKGHKIIPRKIFVALARPKLQFKNSKDLLVMRVIVTGLYHHKKVSIIYQVLEYFDSKTGFTAMQRTTGFSAAVVLEMLARKEITVLGTVPVEQSVPGQYFIQQIKKRGISVHKQRVQHVL